MERTDFADFLNPAIHTVFWQIMQEEEKIYAEIFKEESSDKNQELWSNVSGFPLPTVKGEGEDSDEQRFYQGYDTTLVNVTWSMFSRVTFEMIQDDLKNIIKQIPKQMGQAMVRGKDTSGANIFNCAFSGGGLTYGDGLELCVSNHANSVPGGSTNSNLLTAAPLSPTTLEDAVIKLRLLKADNGTLVGCKPGILLVHPTKEIVAHRIIDSSLRAGSGDNDINVLKSYGIKILSWDKLSDNYRWFLLATNRDNGAIFQNRYNADFKDDEAIKSRDVYYSTLMRYAFGCPDWRWLVGNKATS